MKSASTGQNQKTNIRKELQQLHDAMISDSARKVFLALVDRFGLPDPDEWMEQRRRSRAAVRAKRQQILTPTRGKGRIH